jgi:alginate O-acetyltransferase complex protein AlgI
MGLCGLWHGANWNCVLWGLLNGCLLIGHARFVPWCAARPKLSDVLRSPTGTALRIASTFACFCLTLAVFRTLTVHDAGVMVGRMMLPAGGLHYAIPATGLYLTFIAVAMAHALGHRDRWRRLWAPVPAPIRGLGLGGAVTAALLLAPGVSKAFIYFQF